ncbi:MAG: hypothetical protein V1872_00480 [bacterium]
MLKDRGKIQVCSYFIGILYLSMFCFLLKIFLPLRTCDAAVDVVVSKEQESKIKLALVPFNFEKKGLKQEDSDKRLSSLLKDVLISDLTLSGYFSCQEYDSDSAWYSEQMDKSLKHDLLFRGSYLQKSERIVEVTGTIYDLGNNKEIFTKKIPGNIGNSRRIIHKLVNEIVKELIREKGIALTKIAFISNQTGKKQLYIMDYDGENIFKVDNRSELQISPSWSPSGNVILYSSFINSRSNISMYRLSDQSRKIIYAFPGLNSAAVISPDGKEILLTLSKDGDPEIYRDSLKEGRKIRRLTNNRSIDTSPVWSPDGKRMAFVSDRGGNPQIYISNINGINVKRETFYGQYNTSPAWSPKGDKIVYVCRINGLHQIGLLNLKDSTTTQLTEGKGNKEDPSWAPDSRHIVYSFTEDYKSDIYLLDLYSGDNSKVTKGKANYTEPAWSP